MDKIQEGYLRREESPTHTRPPSQEFQSQEAKSPQLLAAKTRGYGVGGKNFWSPKQFLLKEPTHGTTYSGSFPLSSSTRVSA